MNERYEALFASNRDIFDGARVLDLASHDGRYSFAALKTGAAHVTGVEVRQSLIDKAQETFAFYGQDPETYRFVCGDVFEVLAREKFDVDVVLCLGYLYHTYRHTELMYRLHNLAPKHLIVDTMVVPGTAADPQSASRTKTSRTSAVPPRMPIRWVGCWWRGPRCPRCRCCWPPTVSRSNPCTTGRAGWPADRPCLVSKATRRAGA